MDGITIRDARGEDYPAIAALHLESDLFHHQHLPYIYARTTEAHRSETYIGELIGNEASVFLVAERAGRVVGFAYGYREEKGRFPFHRRRTYLVLENVVVREDLRGAGIGRALLEETISRARELGYSDIMLNVYCFNEAAIGLYKDVGFEAIAQDMILKL